MGRGHGEDGYGRRGKKRLRVRAGLDSKMKHRASKRAAAIVRSRSFSNVTGLRTTGISIALSLVPEQHLPVKVSERGRINDTRGERERLKRLRRKVREASWDKTHLHTGT